MNGAELESQYAVKTGNQNETEKHITDSIEYEIECPRCYNVMTLCSNFDTLFYSCEECDLFIIYIQVILRQISNIKNYFDLYVYNLYLYVYLT